MFLLFFSQSFPKLFLMFKYVNIIMSYLITSPVRVSASKLAGALQHTALSHWWDQNNMQILY